MQDSRLDELREGLAQLKRADEKRAVFGAQKHGYSFGPLVPGRTLRAFEKKYGVVLPDDYRAFLEGFGNGGAGPFYGIFRLGEMDHGFSHRRWKPGVIVGDPGKPFPHTQAWNWPKSRLRALEADESGELDLEYWRPLDGAIPIAHEGCAIRDWLVITGPEAGHVWNDVTSDYGGYRPWGRGAKAKKEGAVTFASPRRGAHKSATPQSRRLPRRRLTFFDWYAEWLSTSLASIA